MESMNEGLNVSEGAKESPSEPGKFPVAHFAASSLTIGEYKAYGAIESELGAKFYYSWRKFAWEILDKDAKRKYKIEVQWDNVLAMRAVAERNMPGYLEIELEKEPKLFLEVDPSPCRPTKWKKIKDFTGGHRTHCLVFPAGVLNKPYERLIKSDRRLLRLSQQPFPSSDSPFFHSANVHIFNYPPPQGPSMPLAIEGLDSHANNLQSYFMPSAAREGEFSFTALENWLMEDDDVMYKWNY